MMVGPDSEESITGSAVEWICWVLDRDPRRSRQRSAECGEYERGDERKGAKHGAFHGNLLKSFSSAFTMPLVSSGFNGRARLLRSPDRHGTLEAAHRYFRATFSHVRRELGATTKSSSYRLAS